MKILLIQNPEAEKNVFEGDPEGAMEEFVALTDEKLTSIASDLVDTSALDVNERPSHKLTDFTIYDKVQNFPRNFPRIFSPSRTCTWFN